MHGAITRKFLRCRACIPSRLLRFASLAPTARALDTTGVGGCSLALHYVGEMMSVCVILSAAAHGRPYWDQEAKPRYWISCRMPARSARRAELPTASSGLASASYEASQAMKRTTPGAIMRYRKPSLHFGNPRLALRGSRGHSQSKSALENNGPSRASLNPILHAIDHEIWVS